jgi:hypothetical protein
LFCIAAFALLSGAVTTTVIDELQRRLETVAAGRVQQTVDTGTTARFELSVPLPSSGSGDSSRRGRAIRASSPRAVPVAVSVYKPHGRLRLQVLTHEIQRAESEALFRHLAEVTGLEILQMSSPETEALVRRAEPKAPWQGESGGGQASTTQRERGGLGS